MSSYETRIKKGESMASYRARMGSTQTNKVAHVTFLDDKEKVQLNEFLYSLKLGKVKGREKLIGRDLVAHKRAMLSRMSKGISLMEADADVLSGEVN